MRLWLAGKLMRLSLRLLGFEPTRTICFSHETWDAAGVGRWGAVVARSAPNTPADVCVLMPLESDAAFDAALAEWDAAHPPEGTP